MSGRVGLDETQAALCRHFLGWQCRLRQWAVRRDGGRPSPGMQPTATLEDGRRLGPINVLITQREPAHSTAQFRHTVLRTHDPAERYASALRLLQAEYYQHPGEFADLLTALFALDSPSCAALLEAERCTLLFDEAAQSYSVPCTVRLLEEEHPARQATYWHNSMFNTAMPGEVQVLAFIPDWSQAQADPPP